MEYTSEDETKSVSKRIKEIAIDMYDFFLTCAFFKRRLAFFDLAIILLMFYI